MSGQVIEMNSAENQKGVVHYSTRGGIPIKLDMSFVFHTIGKGNTNLTEMDLRCYISVCQELKLNPFVPGEVHLVKYDGSKPAQIVIGKHAYIRMGEEHSNYRKRESGVVVLRNNEVFHKEGVAVYKELGETLIGGWCRIYYQRENCSELFTSYREVSLEEYKKGQATWNSLPATMIEKVAVVQGFRETFPTLYHGVYAEGELDNQEVNTEMIVHEIPTDPQVKTPQIHEMFQLATQTYGDHAQAVLQEYLSAYNLSSSAKMKQSQWEKIMNDISEDSAKRKQLDTSEMSQDLTGVAMN